MSMVAVRPARWPWWVWIVAVVAVEAAVVLWGLGQAERPIFGGDGLEYNRLAVNLVRHGVFSEAPSPPYYPTVVRAPGYPGFLAALHLVSLNSVLLVRAAQFALLAITALIVYRIARQVAAGHVAALVAGLLCATYLPMVWFSLYHLTEVAACMCLAWVVWIVLLARRIASLWLWGAVGLALAAATYVRPSFLFLPVAVAAGAVLDSRGRYLSLERWLPASALLATFLIAVLPWTIRNESLTGRLIPMAAASGYSLLASAEQYSGRISYKFTLSDWRRFLQENTIRQEGVRMTPREQVAIDDAQRAKARRIFGRLSASTVLKSLPKRLASLWGPADYPPPGRYSDVAHRTGQLQYGLLVVLVAAGLIMRRRRLLNDWPLWVAAIYLTCLHLVFHVERRYTLPARPALLIYAGVASTVALQALKPRSRVVAHKNQP